MSSFAFRTSGLVALFVLAVAGASCAAGSTDETGIIPGGGDAGTDTSGGGGDTGGGEDTSSPADTGSGEDTSVTTDTGGGDDASTDGSTDGGTDTSDGGGSCSSGCPVNKWDIDGDPLTGECGCEYTCEKKGSTDPIDPDYKDDNCDGSDGVVEKCVFVSATSGDDTNAGTRDKPMKTIASAIAKAKTAGLDVCLSGETYTGQVVMESGVSVYGGFDEGDATFKFKRSAAATTTLNAEGTVVVAPKIDAETHLEGLTINATSPTGIGQSTYGVRSGGGSGTLYVRYDKITVGAGTDGENGAGGANGANGGNGGKGGDGCDGCSGGGDPGTPGASTCSAAGGQGGQGGHGGGAGTNGTNGTGGSGGSGSAKSGCFGGGNTAGDGGSAVTAGGPGTPASVGTALGMFTSAAIYTPARGPNGGDGGVGLSGGGGGGGGGGDDVGGLFCNKDRGGGGGGGGAGGGGSFGVTATGGGSLVVDGCDIKVAKGGAGGAGASGGTGGAAGAGGAGGAGKDDSGDGGRGGNGTAGGAGGPGAGGPGGPSVCVAHAASVSVTFVVGLGKNSCVNSGGGAGGVGGSNGGTSGAAGPTGASGSLITL